MTAPKLGPDWVYMTEDEKNAWRGDCIWHWDYNTNTWTFWRPQNPLPNRPWSVVQFFGGLFESAGTVMVLNESNRWTPLYSKSVGPVLTRDLEYDDYKVLGLESAE